MVIVAYYNKKDKVWKKVFPIRINCGVLRRNTMKKLSLLIPFVLILVCCMVFTVAAQTTDTMTVYVDQANGADTNDGLTETTAVKTMDAAYALLNENLSESGTGTIVLVSNYTHAFAAARERICTSVPSHAYTVVITGKTADTAFLLKNSKQSYLQLCGPTKFEKVTVSINSGSYKFISIHGAGVNGSLTIGDNVTTSDNADLRPTLMAAPYENANDTASSGKPIYMEINSGAWRNVYAGGYTNAVTGNSTLVFNDGLASKISVNYSSTHTGTAQITLNGGTVNELSMPSANSVGKVAGDVTVTFVGSDVKKISSVGTHNSGKTYFDLAADGLILPAGNWSFRNVTGGGSLTMDPGTTLNITGTVTGTTNIAFTDTPSTGEVYVTAPDTVADNAFTFTGTTATVAGANGEKTWTSAGEYVFKGLVLTVNHSDYKVVLYSGISGTNVITPTNTVTEDGVTKYYFEGLAAGTYHSQVSRNGYYTAKKVYSFTSEQMATETVLDVSTEKRVFVGSSIAKWQQISYQEFTDAMMAILNDETAAWCKNYAQYLNTPVFAEGKKHQATTQEEMESYIASLDDANDNMYVYSMGVSGEYGLNMPIVIFTKTDLSGAATLEDAAALVTANNKVTVHYQAQIHGNEPAAGEAALVTIGRLDTAYGDDLLENINIYVIPRMNPDGSKDYTRAVPAGFNANRDMLLLQTKEVQQHHYVYNLFMPEVSIDSHEYTVDNTNNNTAYKDMMVACGYNGNSGEAFIDFSENIAFNKIRPALTDNGLEFSFYTNVVNNKYSVSGAVYSGLRGSVSFLLESRGIGFGNHTMARRVSAHLVALDSIFAYISDNPEAVQAASDAERQRITNMGKTYEETDTLVIAHKQVVDESLQHSNIKYNYLTGEKNGSISVTPKKYVAETTRISPTAYVIPAGQAWTQTVLNLMDMHDISYYYVEAGTAIKLQQYIGTVAAATLTDEQTVVFVKGAYVLPMNQSSGIVLSAMMEPDLVDEFGVDTGNGTAENVGTLAQMGIIPASGETFPIYRYIHDLNAEGKVGTSDVEYKVYVDSANGADTNDAYTEATAAKTIEHAFAQLNSLMALAPEGTEGTVVFLNLYTVGSNTAPYTFPSHDYPVVLTSKTGNEGIVKGGTQTQYRWFAFGGDTTLDNITIQPATNNTYYYLFANGHKLVVENTVKTPSFAGANNHFNISAGRYSGTHTGNADLTILGGTWQHLYMGGYTGSLKGDCNIVINHAEFTGIVQNSYSGTTTGNITIRLDNTQFGSDSVFYAGNANKNHVNGNVTLILGENVNLTEIYTGSRDTGNVTGAVTIVQDGADLSGITIHRGAKNAAGTVGKNVFAYKSGKVEPIVGYDEVQVYVDGAFRSLSAAMTKLSLKPSVTGFGYKAEFTADDAIKEMLVSQGYSIWLDGYGAINRTVSDFRNSLTLRLQNFDIENYGAAKVNAKVYVELSNGLIVETEVVSYSMQDMVELIDTKLNTLTAEQIQAVKNMLEGYAAPKSWNISNLLAWTPNTEE